jgi:uncharacterized membrane protein YfcA
MTEMILTMAIPLLLTGILSGFLAGLLGVGGGVVIVPILSYYLEATGLNTSFAMHIAIATSLAIIVPTSILSARTHIKLGNVDMAVIRSLGLMIFIGALGGGLLAQQLDNAGLKTVFGLLLAGIALLFLIRVVVLHEGLPGQPIRAVIGWLIGLVSALVGIGGGSLSVPTLTAFGWPIHRAVGSAALLGLIISVPGMLSFITVGWGMEGRPDWSLGYVWLPAALLISATAFFMAPIGARTASKLDKTRLRRIFGLFLAVVSLRLIWSGLSAGAFGLGF